MSKSSLSGSALTAEVPVVRFSDRQLYKQTKIAVFIRQKDNKRSPIHITLRTISFQQHLT